MQKTFFSEEIVNDLFMQNENIEAFCTNVFEQNIKNKHSLSSSITYFAPTIDGEIQHFSQDCGALTLNYELPNKKAVYIALELAQAIDKNSAEDVRKIKQKYIDQKEFAQAKDFLNNKCKQVWDIFENQKTKLVIPEKAMKVLGITNIPSLEFLLSDSLKYFEKDNGNSTINIISRILNNKNLNYTLDDICEFLHTFAAKNKIKYNQNTIKYLSYELNFNIPKLNFIGISKKSVIEILKNAQFKVKIKTLIKTKFDKDFLTIFYN